MKSWTILPVGDSALLVKLGEGIDLATNRQAHALARSLAEGGEAGLGECVPSYTSVLVHYNPLALTYAQAARAVEAAVESLAALPDWQPRVVEIPVVYGGEFGPDLEFVARHNRLSEEEVIRLHCLPDYPVYMMGFSPGFPYLGGLDPRITAPRLERPRERVAAGSVGIAGAQTGVYPIESPGGWRIIGRTPLRLFDLRREPPFLLAPGDVVRFVPIERMPDGPMGA